MAEPKRKVVLGLGNLSNRDQGLGVHALRMLGGRLGPQSEVELVEGGVRGPELPPLVEACSHLLVLEAVDAGEAPGSVVELGREGVQVDAGVQAWEHQAAFREAMALANQRGALPSHLHLIGVQPLDLSLGVDVSAPIADALSEVVERAVGVLQSWHLVLEPQTGDEGASST